ncbi:hypothetical protein CDAR_544801 [Caerostris darwini]|uniref:MD-2-related lipid-recognition domain-containing protein n=1 Tax=Caerostris darwini TaxID=1538125 RepID=A0AAV4V7A8_9ARAC|nr:hypothetical protein CDAR_544801 [Caerostris darwini]
MYFGQQTFKIPIRYQNTLSCTVSLGCISSVCPYREGVSYIPVHVSLGSVIENGSLGLRVKPRLQFRRDDVFSSLCSVKYVSGISRNVEFLELRKDLLKECNFKV